MRQALASTVRGTLAVGSLVVLLALAPARARATSYLFVPLDVPGATATEALAIDDAGRDFPGAGARTLALGINGAGDIVGYYNFGAVPDHGFVRRGAFYATLDAPGASETPTTRWSSHAAAAAGAEAFRGEEAR